MKGFKLIIVTPEKQLYNDTAGSVKAPGIEGEMTILAQHAPLLSRLRPGNITVTGSSGPKTFPIKDGFIEVNENAVTILAKQA